MVNILKLFKTKTFDFTAIAGILVAVLSQVGVDVPMELVVSGFVFLAGALRFVTKGPVSDK